MAAEESNTVKISTIFWIVLGLIVPLWPVSLPLCWYFAYRSYKRGEEIDKSATFNLSDIKDAQDLLEKGAITEEDFDRVKSKVFDSGEQKESVKNV